VYKSERLWFCHRCGRESCVQRTGRGFASTARSYKASSAVKERLDSVLYHLTWCTEDLNAEQIYTDAF
jgi:hypothetical protein